VTATSRKTIWLIKVAEPTPLDGAGIHLMRDGILSKRFAEKGYNVIWWHSTINHQNKTQRFTKHSLVKASPNLHIFFLHSILYKKSAGIMRVVSQYGMARAFKKLSALHLQPDIILCCLPPLELCWQAVKYGLRHKVPVIIDVQDLWPDAFMKFAPDALKPVWRLLLKPWYTMVRKACANATAITAITDEFLDWALGYANRDKTLLDKSFPFGYSDSMPDGGAVSAAEKRWETLGIDKNTHDFIACFIGFMGRHYELEIVIEAARKLQHVNTGFKFVLCGTGDNLEKYKQLAAGCSNVIFPGWINEAEIWTLMRRSAVGLAPYKKTATLIKNLTNKPIEYMSAGLPVISSLGGVLETVLSTYECGVTYLPGDSDRLANILIDLHNSPERRSAMSINARKLFQDKFSADKVYGEMVDHIERIGNL
jgi:glycosyltransferase involved in cell wall biosynthesis